MTRKRDAVHLLLSVDGDEEDIVGRVREEDVRCGWRTGLRLGSGHGECES
jgi:hypothetical protein